MELIRSANQILGQKGVNIAKLREIWPEITKYSKKIDEQIEINAHYRGYLVKQKLIYWHLKEMKIYLS